MFSKSLCSQTGIYEEEPVDCESSSYMTQAGITKVEIAQLKNSSYTFTSSNTTGAQVYEKSINCVLI